MTDAENQLKKVRKLEANRSCPNCGTDAPTGLGFGNICVKFQTFVCNDCKSSHQAISHRCKSVSMSTWTVDEVLDLTTQRGGGNEVALRTWLAHAPPVGGRYDGGSRPKKGDKIEVFKQFIVDCYEKRMFYGDLPPTSPITSTSPASPVSPTHKPTRVVSAPVPPTQPQVTVNFFDEAPAPTQVTSGGFDAFGASTFASSSVAVGFDAFDSSSTSGFDFMNSPTTSLQPAAAPSSDFGFSNFDGFASSSPASTKTAPVTNDFDLFSTPAHPVRASSNGFDFAAHPAPAPPVTNVTSFDAFGTSSDVLSFQSPAPPSNSPMSASGSVMNNNRSAMAISGIGMPGPTRGPGMYPAPRGPPATNAFDFVGSAMQSELGRSPGLAMGFVNSGMSSMGHGMNSMGGMGMGMGGGMGMNNGMGMGMGGMGMNNGMGMGGGMGNGMGGMGMGGMGMNNGMGMGGGMGNGMGGMGMGGMGMNSGMGMGGMNGGSMNLPPRGPSNGYQSGGGFPSAW